MLRAVLFDAVGTLLALREPVGDTYARFAGAHGLTAAAAALNAAFPRVLRAMPPMAFPRLAAAQRRAAERAWWRTVVQTTFETAGAGAPPAIVDRCFDELFVHYAGPAAWRARDGARELLTVLRRRGLRTGVISNFDHRLPPLLASLGIAALLDLVVLPVDAGAAKPDAAIFHFALERLGIAAAEAIYVGDDADDDVAGATRAGLRAIDVTGIADLRELAALTV